MHAPYLILKDRAGQWSADAEIQAPVREIAASDGVRYSPGHRDRLFGQTFDRAALSSRGLAYERLDQLAMEVLLGMR